MSGRGKEDDTRKESLTVGGAKKEILTKLAFLEISYRSQTLFQQIGRDWTKTINEATLLLGKIHEFQSLLKELRRLRDDQPFWFLPRISVVDVIRQMESQGFTQEDIEINKGISFIENNKVVTLKIITVGERKATLKNIIAELKQQFERTTSFLATTSLSTDGLLTKEEVEERLRKIFLAASLCQQELEELAELEDSQPRYRAGGTVLDIIHQLGEEGKTKWEIEEECSILFKKAISLRR